MSRASRVCAFSLETIPSWRGGLKDYTQQAETIEGLFFQGD